MNTQQQVQEIFNAKKANVESSFPSIYSKEDVLKGLADLENAILQSLEVEEPANDGKITDNDVNDLIDDLVEAIELEDGTSLIGDYELAMRYGNEVEIESLNWDKNEIVRIVKEAVIDWQKELKNKQ